MLIVLIILVCMAGVLIVVYTEGEHNQDQTDNLYYIATHQKKKRRFWK